MSGLLHHAVWLAPRLLRARALSRPTRMDDRVGIDGSQSLSSSAPSHGMSVRQHVRVGMWTRLVEWDKRVSRKVGVRFDDPQKTPEENIHLARRRRRYGLRPPIVVGESDFLTTDEAKRLLRSRFAPSPNVNILIARGILQPCFVEDGRQGVTRSSVEQEAEWRRTASRWKKFTRRLGGVLHWV